MENNILKDMSQDDLENTLKEKKKSLMNFRFQKAYGQLSDTSVLKKHRREIARLKTYIQQKTV